MKQVIIVSGWHLVDTDGKPVYTGDIMQNSATEEVAVVGGLPPHKPDSSGYVLVTPPNAKPAPNNTNRFYAHVYGCKWVRALHLSWFQCQDLHAILNSYIASAKATNSAKDVNMYDEAHTIQKQLEPYV